MPVKKGPSSSSSSSRAFSLSSYLERRGGGRAGGWRGGEGVGAPSVEIIREVGGGRAGRELEKVR